MATLNDWILYNYGDLPEADRNLIKTAGLDKEYNQYSGGYYNTGGEGYTQAQTYLKNTYGSKYANKTLYGGIGTAGQLGLAKGDYNYYSLDLESGYYSLKDSAFSTIARNQGYKPQDYNAYYGGKFGTEFTPEQISAATQAYNDAIWSNPEALRYKLYKSNALLGDDANAGNFQKQLVEDYVGETTPFDYGGTKPVDLRRDQLAVAQAIDRELNALGTYTPEDVEYMWNKYNLTKPDYEGAFPSVYQAQYLTREQTSKWYKTPDVGTVEKIFENRYKTASPFGSDTDIERARNIVYGEAQKPVDLGEGWKELYQTYGKWKAQDERWYQDMLQSQGIYEGAKGVRRAEMAAGGMATGSEQWQRNLDKVDKLRFDLEEARKNKEEALKNTSVYQALEENYKALYKTPEVRAKEKAVTKYRNELVKEGYVKPAYTTSVQRYDSETGRVYWDQVTRPAQYVPPQYASVPYQDYETKETKTGNFAYTGTDEAPDFDTFYRLNFGDMDFSNVDAVQPDEISNQESESERKARQAAGGMFF